MRCSYFLLALAFFCFSVRAEKDARVEVVRVAESLIGVKEDTGRNDGEVVEKILASVGLSKGAPYCAAFNYWCYQQAGEAAKVPKSGWSPDWLKKPTWTRSGGGEPPKPADAFGIYFKNKGRIAHTGLVKIWGSSTVVTLEGNTSPEARAGSASDRDGGGIWSKRRLKIQIYSVRNWID